MTATSGERTRELLSQLETQVQALTDSDAWKRYLTMQARLHKYSFGNCLLIGAQCPTATHVAGYQAWRELGRQVRKGESGIRIMVPFVYRKREASETETGEDREAYVRFGTGHVFDIAQTDGEEIGAQWGYVQGDASAAARGLARLETYAQSLGYTVTRAASDGSARGHTAFKSRSIVIGDLDVVNAAATLAHELAHVLLHEGITDYRANRSLYEVEAESVAYVVVTGLGLDASGCSLPYVATWASRGDATAVRALGERVHKAANKLLSIADAPTADEQPRQTIGSAA